jgi:rare lipoprotein A
MQLQNGSLVYAPAAGNLRIRLDVLAGESVATFAGSRTPVASDKQDVTGVQAVPGVRGATENSASVQLTPGTSAEAGGDKDKPLPASQTGTRERTDNARQRRGNVSGETGIASFYYRESNPDELVAAYFGVPLGSRVRVTNLANGRSVVLRVTDHGPSVNRSGIINVSYRAAEELGFAQVGTARVRVELER